jgi:hypothetical protein
MKRSTREQRAEEYAHDEKFTVSPYYWDKNSFVSTEIGNAYLAGWDARKEVERKTLPKYSCECLHKLEQVE